MLKWSRINKVSPTFYHAWKLLKTGEFFRAYFHYCLSCVHHCEHHSHIHLLIRRVSSLIWFPYILSHRFITSRVYSANTMTSSLLTCKLTQCKFGRTRHQNRRGHGFKSRTDLNFFGPYFLYRSSDVHYCEDRFHIHSYICFPIGPLSSIFFLGEGLVGSRLTALIFLSRFKQPLIFMIEKWKALLSFLCPTRSTWWTMYLIV